MRRRLTFLCGAVLTLAAAAPEGIRLDIVNRSAETLECHAIAGHWYGFDLGKLPPGGATAITLGRDGRDGALSLPNSLGQPIPLQSIYCGRAGDAWRTRADIALRDAIEAGPAAQVICRDNGGALVCS